METAQLDGNGDYDLIVGVTGRFGMESANRLLADGTMSGSLSYDSMVVSALTFDDSVSAEVRQALAYLIPMTEAADTPCRPLGPGGAGQYPAGIFLLHQLLPDGLRAAAGKRPGRGGTAVGGGRKRGTGHPAVWLQPR